MLVQLNPTAFVALNRMTVVFKISGAAETLQQLQRSPFLKDWEKHYIYYSLLGEIYSSSDKQKAVANFEKAISLTGSEAEKKLLRKKIEAL
jgi:RNA polymerase sigma-70 factor (ECF subfamily)